MMLEMLMDDAVASGGDGVMRLKSMRARSLPCDETLPANRHILDLGVASNELQPQPFSSASS